MSKYDYSQKFPSSRTSQFITQRVEDEMLIYDLQTDKAICLNPTTYSIWEKCDGKTSIADLIESFDGEFDVDAREEIVLLTLSELDKANLLKSNCFEMPPKTKLSRRRLISEYGVPMAALPVIMSLVAPVAAGTQSCIQPGGACDPMGLECCFGIVCQEGFCSD